MSASASRAFASGYSRVTSSRQRKRAACLAIIASDAVEVRVLVAPAAQDRRVPAVDLAMRVERRVPGVGVLPDDDVAARVAEHLEAFRDGSRIAGGLDHDVGAPARRALAHPARARRGIATSVMSSVSSAPRRRAASSRAFGAPTTKTRNAPESCAKIAAFRPTGPRPGRRPCRPSRPRRARPRESRSAGRSRRPGSLRRRFLGQRHQPHARKDLDPLRPAAEQAVARRRGDAVDPPVGTARRRAGDEAVPARAAGAVDVVERDERARGDRPPFDVGSGPSVSRTRPTLTWPGMIGYGTPRRAGRGGGARRCRRPRSRRLEHRAAGARTRRGDAPRLERTAGRRHEDGRTVSRVHAGRISIDAPGDRCQNFDMRRGLLSWDFSGCGALEPRCRRPFPRRSPRRPRRCRRHAERLGVAHAASERSQMLEYIGKLVKDGHLAGRGGSAWREACPRSRSTRSRSRARRRRRSTRRPGRQGHADEVRSRERPARRARAGSATQGRDRVVRVPGPKGITN